MRHQRSGASGHKQLQLWYCADCSGVHLRTDHVSLTFSNEEFAQLSEAVMEMSRDNVAEHTGEHSEEQAAVTAKDDVLDSDLIA